MKARLYNRFTQLKLIFGISLTLTACNSSGLSDVTGDYFGTVKLPTGITLNIEYDIKDSGGYLSGRVYTPTSNYSLSGSRNGSSASFEHSAGGYTWKVSGNFSDKSFTGAANIYNGSSKVGTADILVSK